MISTPVREGIVLRGRDLGFTGTERSGKFISVRCPDCRKLRFRRSWIPSKTLRCVDCSRLAHFA